LVSLQSAFVVQRITGAETLTEPGVLGPIVIVVPERSQSAPRLVSVNGTSNREMLRPDVLPFPEFGPVHEHPAGGVTLTEGPVSKAT